MTTAPSPWTDRDHSGPATPEDTDKHAATDAPAEAPVNPLLIGEAQQLPKGDRRA